MFKGPITGRKFFAIFAGAFGIIIAVNLTLAYYAVKTFSGLEVKNSYIASQTFNDRKHAQDALGWKVEAIDKANELHLLFTDQTGAPVELGELEATVGRATTVAQDQTPQFTFTGREYTAPLKLGGGNWNIRINAVSKDGVMFTQRLVLHIEE